MTNNTTKSVTLSFATQGLETLTKQLSLSALQAQILHANISSFGKDGTFAKQIVASTDKLKELETTLAGMKKELAEHPNSSLFKEFVGEATKASNEMNALFLNANPDKLKASVLTINAALDRMDGYSKKIKKTAAFKALHASAVALRTDLVKGNSQVENLADKIGVIAKKSSELKQASSWQLVKDR